MAINNLNVSVNNPSHSATTSTGTIASQANHHTQIAAVTARPVQPIQSAQATNPASKEQVQEAVEQIKEVTDNLAQNLQFSIDEDTGTTVVKILDSQTQEVIRQMPTEEALSIAKALDKVQGLLFDEKA